MPYINGQRVSNQEWIDRFSSLKKLHTGPNGENPAKPVDLVAETGAPEPQPKRSPRNAAAAKAAIADAMGVSTDSEAMTAIDVTGMDADSDDGTNPTDTGDLPDDAGSEPGTPIITSAGGDEPAFECPTCGFAAKSALGLGAHQRAKHKE